MRPELTATQTLEAGAYIERCRVLGGEELVRVVHVPVTHVRWSRKGAMRAYVLATGLLRLLVKLLYVFPVFVVLKAVLWVANAQVGDLIVVAFVQLVVLIFAVLAVVVLLWLFVGPRSERRHHGALAFHPPTAHEIERLLRRGGTRITGRVDAGIEEGACVLSDRWDASEGALVRRFAGSSFVVFTDEGQAVAVALASCPTLLGPYEGAEAIIRQGERVELIARNVRDAIHADDARLDEIVRNAEGGLAPYRQIESTLRVVESTAREPILLRRAAR